MKSKANVKGHPIHPVLVGFPIAFLTGTLVLDIVGYYNQDPVWLRFAGIAELAGIVTALVAAIPGAVDYFYTIPPDSSAKARGTKHALINVAALVLFIIAYCVRNNSQISGIVLICEIIGTIGLGISGWLGSTLVNRNQIGIDLRYANAGKWNEATFAFSDLPIEIADVNELEVGQMKLLHLGQKRIVLAKTEDGYTAFDDHCSHKGGSLAGGALICGTVQCPWHGSQFDCHTGEVKAGPAKDKIKIYRVEERSGKVYFSASKGNRF